MSATRRCGARVRVCDLFTVRLEPRGETAEASDEVNERHNEIRNGYASPKNAHKRASYEETDFAIWSCAVECKRLYVVAATSKHDGRSPQLTLSYNCHNGHGHGQPSRGSMQPFAPDSHLKSCPPMVCQWLAEAVQAWFTLMVDFITIHRVEFLVDRGHTLVDALAVTCPKTSPVFLNPSSSCRLHPHYRVPDL
jgi:hypothetical protein